MRKKKDIRKKKDEKIKSLIKGPLIRRKKPLHYSSGYKVNKDIKKEIEKRYNILTVAISCLVLVLIGGLFFF